MTATGTFTSTDIVLVTMGAVMVVVLGALLAYFLYDPKKGATSEEVVPLRSLGASDGPNGGNEAQYGYFSESTNHGPTASPTRAAQIESDIEAALSDEVPKSIVERIFEEGNILMHTSKGPRNVSYQSICTCLLEYLTETCWQVTFSITDSELMWSSPVTNKTYSIRLKDLKFTEVGKRTANFQKRASADAVDAHCFSRVGQSTTVDIEVPTKMTRDRLVDAFNHIIATTPASPEKDSPYG
jgi:hypothetical protein